MLQPWKTDLYGNRIIVNGTALQVEQIKQVLTDLGEDGTGLKKKGEGGNIRRYSLRGRDPEEFFKYLEQEWQASEKYFDPHCRAEEERTD